MQKPVRAPQPVLAMETALEHSYTALGSVTKSSAKTADFLVRVYNPGRIVYSCILLGVDASHYCEASVKTSTDDVKGALEKHNHGTTWRLSGVCFDGHCQEEFLHRSVLVVVDLKHTPWGPVLQGTEEEKSLAVALVRRHCSGS